MMLNRTKHQGFTLLEIMLVIALMALTSVAVISTMAPSRNDEVHAVAQRLFQRIRLTSEDAVLSGRNYGVLFDEPKHRFLFEKLTTKGWQPLTQSDLKIQGFKGVVELPDGITADMQMGSDQWQGRVEDSEDARFPHVLILGSGDVTPMTLVFRKKYSSEVLDSWNLTIQENGDITLKAAGEGSA